MRTFRAVVGTVVSTAVLLSGAVALSPAAAAVEPMVFEFTFADSDPVLPDGFYWDDGAGDKGCLFTN